MTRTETEQRILRGLRRGPLYGPALALVVGGNRRTLYAALGRLIEAGEVERLPAARSIESYRLAR